MKVSRIQLDHGAGGRASQELVSGTFLPALENPILGELNDSALLDIKGMRLAMSTDSYVVDPIFFPGGDIGSLAIHGTVNDLAMRGAQPLYLSVGFILEEGLEVVVLERLVDSMAAAAREAEVKVVAADTKVVPRGKADRIYINSAGIGAIPPGVEVAGQNGQVGDVVLINGPMGDHGVAVLSTREGLSFQTGVKSDSASLNTLVADMLAASRKIHVMRDPTRGGVATALNEVALQSGVGIRLEEQRLPTRSAVNAACEMLGLDPLYVANEGKVLVFVAPEDADLVLSAMHRHRLGREACKIGEVVSDHPGRVVLQTGIGGTRIVDMLSGEQLPRIC
ncbi:MAG: hydrogenase expression/formation protein HypE [Deltaproteobacteria bacterium]|nr:MAG: hydrogenase expression/formation protein HypE [Deltaproteobacteria bacterium]